MIWFRCKPCNFAFPGIGAACPRCGVLPPLHLWKLDGSDREIDLRLHVEQLRRDLQRASALAGRYF